MWMREWRPRQVRGLEVEPLTAGCACAASCCPSRMRHTTLGASEEVGLIRFLAPFLETLPSPLFPQWWGVKGVGTPSYTQGSNSYFSTNATAGSWLCASLAAWMRMSSNPAGSTQHCPPSCPGGTRQAGRVRRSSVCGEETPLATAKKVGFASIFRLLHSRGQASSEAAPAPQPGSVLRISGKRRARKNMKSAPEHKWNSCSWCIPLST